VELYSRHLKRLSRLIRRKDRHITKKQKIKFLSCRMVVWGFIYTIEGGLGRSLGCEYF